MAGTGSLAHVATKNHLADGSCSLSDDRVHTEVGNILLNVDDQLVTLSFIGGWGINVYVRMGSGYAGIMCLIQRMGWVSQI